MKRLIAILSFITLFQHIAFAQQKEQYAEITYVKIVDTTLISYINKVWALQLANSDTSSLFRKGYGYISLSVVKHPNTRDTVIVYHITPDLHNLTKENIDWVYPDHYSYVGNHLVLITVGALHAFTDTKYSEKSKKNIRKLLDKCLVKKQRMAFYKADGTKAFTVKDFRLDYISIHNGYYLYVFLHRPPLLLHDIGGKEF